MGRSEKSNNILNLLYRGTTTIQDFCWDNMTTVPILSLLTEDDIDFMRRIILSARYSGNNKLKMQKLDEVMNFRGFTRFAGGTNRLVYIHPSAPNAVFKVAIDSVGINDNPAEFRNQELLKPYCCKVFECSPCGTIASFERVERITTFEEFYSIADDYFYILSRVILGKYIMEDIGIDYFMNIGIRKGCHPVLLDFPYLFELDGAKLKCQNVLDDGSICNGDIDYDPTFNHIVCKKCGRMYRARDLAKADKINKGVLVMKKDNYKVRMRIFRNGELIKSVNCDEPTREYLNTNDRDMGKNGIPMLNGNTPVPEKKVSYSAIPDGVDHTGWKEVIHISKGRRNVEYIPPEGYIPEEVHEEPKHEEIINDIPEKEIKEVTHDDVIHEEQPKSEEINKQDIEDLLRHYAEEMFKNFQYENSVKNKEEEEDKNDSCSVTQEDINHPMNYTIHSSDESNIEASEEEDTEEDEPEEEIVAKVIDKFSDEYLKLIDEIGESATEKMGCANTAELIHVFAKGKEIKTADGIDLPANDWLIYMYNRGIDFNEALKIMLYVKDAMDDIHNKAINDDPTPNDGNDGETKKLFDHPVQGISFEDESVVKDDIAEYERNKNTVNEESKSDSDTENEEDDETKPTAKVIIVPDVPTNEDEIDKLAYYAVPAIINTNVHSRKSDINNIEFFRNMYHDMKPEEIDETVFKVYHFESNSGKMIRVSYNNDKGVFEAYTKPEDNFHINTLQRLRPTIAEYLEGKKEG